MNAVEINRLSKNFGHQAVLKNISLSINTGEIYGFLGPNGAGKTTTIRCLMDFIRPNTGTITIFDHDAKANGPLARRDIGFLSADNQFYGDWTALDHIKLIQNVRGKSPRAKALAKRLDLDLTTKVKHLSTGNQQKLSLVLAMMAEPKLLVMDEPTRGLDPLLQAEIYDMLREFRDSGGTVFMSSHNLPEVEQICDRVGVIKAGRLIRNESLSRLRQMRTHIVTAVFARPYPTSDLRIKGLSILKKTATSVTFKIRGDLNAVMRILARRELKDLEISHANLEEIFMEFYK